MVIVATMAAGVTMAAGITGVDVAGVETHMAFAETGAPSEVAAAGMEADAQGAAVTGAEVAAPSVEVGVPLEEAVVPGAEADMASAAVMAGVAVATALVEAEADMEVATGKLYDYHRLLQAADGEGDKRKWLAFCRTTQPSGATARGSLKLSDQEETVHRKTDLVVYDLDFMV